MKLPTGVLEKIRGPMLAAALAGCAGQGATATLTSEPTPEPEPQPPTTVAAIDPVSYDPATESDRYARLDQMDARDELTRQERLAEEEAAHRPVRQSVQPPLPPIGRPDPYIMAACGRG